MSDLLIQEVHRMFPDKAFLTVEEVASLMQCSPDVVYNWTRRSDPKRRPPRLPVGKEIRFPKTSFAQWLANEMGA